MIKSKLKPFTGIQQKQLIKAYNFAKKAHKGQIRRSGEDFLIHPTAVAEILIEWNVAASMIIGAMLHDCVEDSYITIERIEKEFGQEVALYVFALTKDFFQGKILKKNISFLTEEPNILVIKLADRLHNLRTMENMPPATRKIKAGGTLSIYVPIARALKMYKVAEELKTLAEKYYIS